MTNGPSLDLLEWSIARHDADLALRQLLAILREIDHSYGRISGIAAGQSLLPLSEKERADQFATRLAAAIGSLITDQSYSFDDDMFADLVVHHRWVSIIFAVSSFRTTEHLVSALLGAAEIGDRERLLRLLACFPARALASVDLADFLLVDESATLTAALQFVGNRYCFFPGEYDLRERLLEWLPDRLGDDQLRHLRPNMLVEPYMLCSYATTQRKHDIKANIIELMRRACLAGDCREWDGEAPPPRQKPLIFVSTEAFGPGHSVFRTHSRSVRALREKFHVVGICFQPSLTPESRACFDEVILYPDGDFIAGIKTLADAILDRRPDMLLQLGVGMAPHTIALASLRLVPIQVASFAHTATSNSRFVDQMILPSDFVSDSGTFVEPLLMVPPGAMPYALRPDGEEISKEAKARPRSENSDNPVRIGLPAAIMKLNPRLFAALSRISDAASRQVEFHLFPLASVGLARMALERAIGLPNVVVREELDYEAYLRELGLCDFFICPFPYGNVNSVIDCIRLGLPGVCLDGPQPHAHADGSLFRRAGLPEALIAQNLDDYVAAVVRLVDDEAWRNECRNAARAADLLSPDFNGDASAFCDALFGLLTGH